MNESLRNTELKEGCAAKDLGAGVYCDFLT